MRFFSQKTGFFIYSFHIPLFILLSGYTFSVPSDIKTIFNKTKKSFVQLIVPAVLACFLEFLISVFIKGNSFNNIFPFYMRKVIYGNGVIWFLFALFYARIIFNILLLMNLQFKFKKINNLLVILFLLVMNVFLFAYFPQFKNAPQNMDLVLFFVFLLYAGNQYKNHVETLIAKYEDVVGLVSLFVLLFLINKRMFYFDFGLRHIRQYFFSLLGMFSGISFMIVFCKKIDKIQIFQKFFGIISQHSILLLFIHEIEASFKLSRLFYFQNSIFMVFVRIVFNLSVFFIMLAIRYAFNKIENKYFR